MTVKRSDTAPAYQLVASELRTRISAGEFPDGVRLPTEAELAQQYRLSRQTIRRAFVDLVAEGIVYRVPGRGSFAAADSGRYLRRLGSIEDLMSLSLDTVMQIVTPMRRRVDIDAASRLRLDSDIQYSLTFRRLHDEVPFVLTSLHLTPHSAKLLAEVPELQAGAVSTATVIGLLDPRLASPIAEAEQSITVAPANAEVADALGCPVGHPMLRVDRLYSNDLGEPVELSISHFLPEHYTYRVTLGRDNR
ncbi:MULTISPECIES: GntR family transcriptional regulator [Nocardia]|uniref:GntR family transcriptional regulator n=1 Tax=Nocardia aurea TaxID=2144174 RepID=A0ABV3FSK8_9NOCA|nr:MULTISPECIES: GntR family transcriptional regulator [Nocardia]